MKKMMWGNHIVKAYLESWDGGKGVRTVYLDENGNFIEVEKPNAYKFEKFIFDSFKLFNNISILRGKREEDFAPVKNMNGEDSPETAKKLYENYWKKA